MWNVFTWEQKILRALVARLRKDSRWHSRRQTWQWDMLGRRKWVSQDGNERTLIRPSMRHFFLPTQSMHKGGLRLCEAWAKMELQTSFMVFTPPHCQYRPTPIWWLHGQPNWNTKRCQHVSGNMAAVPSTLRLVANGRVGGWRPPGRSDSKSVTWI